MGFIAMLNLFLGLVSIRLFTDIDDMYRYPVGKSQTQDQFNPILKLVIYIIIVIIFNIIISKVLKKKELNMRWYKHIIWAIITFVFPPLFFYSFVFFKITLDNLRSINVLLNKNMLKYTNIYGML